MGEGREWIPKLRLREGRGRTVCRETKRRDKIWGYGSKAPEIPRVPEP
jgi:hypothetical protein